MYRVGIITASDKGSRGERVDESGAKIKEIVGEFGYEVKFYRVLPDDKEVLAEEMKNLCDNNEVDLILTTGGTGFSKRDNTPEATLLIAEKLVPGISEAIRAYRMQFTKKAMLSRAVSSMQSCWPEGSRSRPPRRRYWWSEGEKIPCPKSMTIVRRRNFR